MTELRVKVSALRQGLGVIVCRIRELSRPVVVVKHGQPVAAIISMDDYNELQRLRRWYQSVGDTRHVA